MILAFVDSQPAGLIVCFEGFSTFACKPLLNIHDVIVASPYRGRGISKLMLQKVEDIAFDLGYCKLTLEVLEGNHVAQSAYKAFGFGGYELNPKMGKALFLGKEVRGRRLHQINFRFCQFGDRPKSLVKLANQGSLQKTEKTVR